MGTPLCDCPNYGFDINRALLTGEMDLVYTIHPSEVDDPVSQAVFAQRIADIAPFHVMDILAQAKSLEQQGRSVIHLEVGEPDFSAPETIVQASLSALQAGKTHYTAALGLPELRQAVAQFYHSRYACEVDAEQVAITPGASGALQLILGAVINPDDEVIMADPGYPCNRHFVRLFGGHDVSVAVDHSSQYQLTAALIEQNLSPKTKAVMLASPSNPTGTLLSAQALAAIVELCRAKQLILIVDEIYLGLTYGVEESTAAQYLNGQNIYEHLFVINSFSKYFGMTGMRAGWLLCSQSYMPAIDCQAQNFFLATATPAQYGALAAFDAATIEILEQRRQAFQQRRDYLYAELPKLGFELKTQPEGAFYLYADSSKLSASSSELCADILAHVGVALTPGKDFGSHRPEQHVRFAYTRDIAQLSEAVQRLKAYFAGETVVF